MINYRLKGIDKVVKWTKDMTEEMEEEVKVLVANTAYRIEEEAKKSITEQKAVDTGHLRRNINTVFPMKDKGLSASIGTNVEYALYVEFGTKKMNERPFLIPAFLKYKKIFEQELKKTLKGR